MGVAGEVRMRSWSPADEGLSRPQPQSECQETVIEAVRTEARGQVPKTTGGCGRHEPRPVPGAGIPVSCADEQSRLLGLPRRD